MLKNYDTPLCTVTVLETHIKILMRCVLNMHRLQSPRLAARQDKNRPLPSLWVEHSVYFDLHALIILDDSCVYPVIGNRLQAGTRTNEPEFIFI